MKDYKNLPYDVSVLEFGNERLLENTPQRDETDYLTNK